MCRGQDPEWKAFLSQKAKERIATDGGAQIAIANQRSVEAKKQDTTWRDFLGVTLALKNHTVKVRGGKGHGLTVPQQSLLDALGESFVAEHVVLTGLPKGQPTWYQLDIVHLERKIDVEVDGNSHGSVSRKAKDEQRTNILTGLGWRVLRFTNQEVLSSLDEVVAKIRSLCTT
jgi:hypothetical protein